MAVIAAPSILKLNAAKSNSSSLSAEALKVSGAYERTRGKPLGDGVVPNLVQVHRPTRLELASGKRVHWFVASEPGTSNGDKEEKLIQLTSWNEPASSAEHTFTSVGKHTVVAREVEADGTTLTGAAHTFTANSKVVRYDIRDLSESDRSAYFEALHKFYVTSSSEGASLYGPNYQVNMRRVL